MRALLFAASISAFLFACGGSSGPEGSVSKDCREHAEEMARETHLDDPFIPGVITVGIFEDVRSPGPAERLRALGTSYFIPVPYQQAAVVCVKPGHEDRWIETLKATGWVEWAHTESPVPALSGSD